MIGIATIVVDQNCCNCGWSELQQLRLIRITSIAFFASIEVSVATIVNIATIVIKSVLQGLSPLYEWKHH